jgi:predicted RNase H-like nuclease
MKFLGIDLGWLTGPSGLCELGWHQGRLQLLKFDRLDTDPKHHTLLSWIDHWVEPDQPALIAVDAPTIITNATGMRLCDRLTHHHFHRYHAAAYPANLSRPFAAQTLALGHSLETRGFDHAPTLQPRQLGRYQVEVFPHPATIHLFQLPQILKYKKGKLGQRRLALSQLFRHILLDLPNLEPALKLSPILLKLARGDQSLTFETQLNFEVLSGINLKAIEDQMDALLCAYMGAYWWYWGLEKNWVLGDPASGYASGYIIVPAPLSDELGMNFNA